MGEYTLIPGTIYDFLLYNYVGVTYSPFQILGSTTAMSITTTGESLTVPAVPQNLRAVDLGDGVDHPSVELIWNNTSNNEDGFITEQADNPNFLGHVVDDVGADTTNDIGEPFFNGTVYYRIASYKGNAQSAWSPTVSITPFHSPVAMAISWIPGNGAYIPFDQTSNHSPPSAFTDDSFANWKALQDFRNVLSVQVGINIDPYTGEITGSQSNIQKYAGYTPVLGVPLKGQSPDPTVTKVFNADYTQVTVIVLARFRVNSFENWGYFGTASWWDLYPTGNLWPIGRLHTPHRLAWAWAKISYTINVNGTASGLFNGSLVPSQTDYWENIQSGSSYQMSSNISPFNTAPFGSLGPSNGTLQTAGGN